MIRKKVPLTEQGHANAVRAPIFALLSAEAVSQVGNMMTVTAGPWFVQERTPPQMLGRTFGTLTALVYVGIPIGSVPAGVLVRAVGLVPTIAGMGANYLAVTLGMFFNPALKRMDAGRGL
jgi:hypothetical protein